MSLNLEIEISLGDIHHGILLEGLGEIGGRKVPYPSAEYVQHNLLLKSTNPEYEALAGWYQRHPQFKPDKTWELITHWCIEGLAIGGFDIANPHPELLRPMRVTKKSLLDFFKGNDYAVPENLVSRIGIERKPLTQFDLKSEHFTPELRVVVAAANEFWKTADRDDKSTHPSNEEVAEWLENNNIHCVSASNAKKYASMIRPHWAAKGRRRGS